MKVDSNRVLISYLKKWEFFLRKKTYTTNLEKNVVQKKYENCDVLSSIRDFSKPHKIDNIFHLGRYCYYFHLSIDLSKVSMSIN